MTTEATVPARFASPPPFCWEPMLCSFTLPLLPAEAHVWHDLGHLGYLPRFELELKCSIQGFWGQRPSWAPLVALRRAARSGVDPDPWDQASLIPFFSPTCILHCSDILSRPAPAKMTCDVICLPARVAISYQPGEV